MNNSIKISLLNESDCHRVAFSKEQLEGGINETFHPESGTNSFTVYTHIPFPFECLTHENFPNFSDAKNFAKDFFDESWEFHQWNQEASRPCADDSCSCGKKD